MNTQHIELRAGPCNTSILADASILARDYIYGDLDQLTANGSAFAYFFDGDVFTWFDILLNEPLPPHVLQRGHARCEPALLEVPSGTLIAAGWWQVTEESGSGATHASIPPGRYVLDAVDFGDEVFDIESEDLASLVVVSLRPVAHESEFRPGRLGQLEGANPLSGEPIAPAVRRGCLGMLLAPLQSRAAHRTSLPSNPTKR